MGFGLTKFHKVYIMNGFGFRSQDLIPRVMLCLTKLGQLGQGQHLDEISRDALSQRSSELLNLMKLPQ